VILVEGKGTSSAVKEVVFDRSTSVVWNLRSRLTKYRKKVGSVKLVELKLYVHIYTDYTPSHLIVN
jgi:hypothetical protein